MTSSHLVVGLGELLWDFLPDGKKLGGAPANFAYHAGGFGHKSLVLSRLGNDVLGDEAATQLKEHALETEQIQRDSTHPTGTVQVELKNGHPSYTIVEDVAWDYMEATVAWMEIAARTDAVCFGTLAQRNPASRAAIQAFVKAVPRSALRILDVNLRGAFYNADLIDASLKLSNVFKLNDQELPIIGDLLGIAPGSEEDRAAALVQKYDLRLLALTRGEKGSLCVTPDRAYAHTGFTVNVSDTVGAGDAFTAGIADGLLRNLSLEDMADSANRRGAWVATHSGAMPPLPTYDIFHSLHHAS